MDNKKLYYFLSDVHLGVKHDDPAAREKSFSIFLSSLPKNTKALYLLGDIFDFWYEYKYVVPRGFTRVLGQLASLVDRGVDVYFLKGNHDIWVFNYFEKELGVKVLDQPHIIEIEGKTFCLGHGDGLGYTTPGFRVLRWIFHSPTIQKAFSALHPRWALGFGNAWSNSRKKNYKKSSVFTDDLDSVQILKKLPIYKYSENFLEQYKYKYKANIDYFIFGHYHFNVSATIGEDTDIYLLDDWVKNEFAYICYDGDAMKVCVKPAFDGSHLED